MKRLAVILTLLLIMFVAVPAGAAQADTLFDRIIRTGETVEEEVTIFGGNLELQEGATIEGDVFVAGGTAVFAGDIIGDVAIMGGDVTLSGTVDGDLVVFGGNLTIESAGVVDGDCLLFGGNLSGDGSTSSSCSAIADDWDELAWLPGLIKPPSPPDRVSPPAVPAPPAVPTPPGGPVVRGGPSFFDRFFGTIGEAAGRSLLLGLLALLAAVIVPNQLNQVEAALRRKPAASGAVGLLTAVAGPSLLVLLLILSAILTLICVGLLGFPIALVLGIMLAAAAVMGWIAVGNLVGKRLASALSLKNRSLPVTAALGTAILTLASSLLSALPFWLGGWVWAIAAFMVACIGLGAVALTKFGTRTYPVAAENGQKVETVLETLPETDSGQEPPK